MSGDLLQTKLYVPRMRQSLVPRPHLIEKLNAGLDGKLTLLSAPAGFGKTTLISKWIANCERPSAWLSLDEGDADLTRFLTYLVAALQTIVPTIGEGVLTALQSPQPPSTESILTSLLNEITAVSENPSTGSRQRLILVLDDYHLVDAQPVDQALAFLLEHLPPQMHLVMTTREDPNLPLPRLRACGLLTELRVADLRFTVEETAVFLNQVTGLELSAEEVASLDKRTEGWVAGLQLAALSMQGRADVSGFIEAFAGDNRYILDYLVEEVLQSQSEQVRSFLLQTSILDRLSGSLCDAVVGREIRDWRLEQDEESDVNLQLPISNLQSQETLEQLENANLFVIPLDDRRHWYRYHHLFADVLRAYLMKEQPQKVPILHQRASEWYEQNDLTADAVHHALVAGDFERAARIIEMAWPPIFKGFQPATWLGWVKALPDALVRTRPVLSVGCAWTLLDGGEFEAAEAHLGNAERWADAVEMVVVNEEEFRSLPATIATGRAYLAQALGDAPAAVKNAQHALSLLPEEDYYWRGIAALFLGLAYWTGGDLDTAYQAIVRSVASLHQAGNIHFQIVGTVVMGNIKMAQGRLREAESTFEQALQLATEQGEPLLQGTIDLYVGLSELCLERGNLETAVQHLQKGQELGKQSVFPGSEHRLSAAMARIKMAQGDPDTAHDLLYEAERFYTRDSVPDLRPAAALKAWVWLGQGRLAEALDWVRERDSSTTDDLSYLHEFEHTTLARVRIAQFRHDRGDTSIHEAMSLLERLLQAAEAGGRMGSVIEILILQALAYQLQETIPNALTMIKRALTLAEPEGYIRVFADEGQPMRTLLAASLAQGVAPGYVTRLMQAIDQPADDDATPSDLNQLLIEPLSNRELEVLRLLAAGLSNQAIADELVIAISTVKKHVNNVFGKLSVASRTQAVNRANDLDLL